jgi:hypothetical protein
MISSTFMNLEFHILKATKNGIRASISRLIDIGSSDLARQEVEYGT